MLKTLGIIEASSTATRPGRHRLFNNLAFRRLAGQSLVEWVVRRVTEAQRLDGVIVLAEDTAEGKLVASLVPPDIPVFLGSQCDPLSRVVAAIREYHTVSVVRVRVDSPFVDPELIDGLIRAAGTGRDCDYVSYCSSDGRPAVLSKIGIFAEWCRAEALRRADREANRTVDRLDVTRYLYTHPGAFQVRLIPIPEKLDRQDVRLTLDGQEDWDHMEQILDALGSECLNWQRIAGLLDQQPALRRRMAVLNRADRGP
jgi:spore coat polysaccharide biosynthesis protein SpsF